MADDIIATFLALDMLAFMWVSWSVALGYGHAKLAVDNKDYTRIGIVLMGCWAGAHILPLLLALSEPR